MFSRLYDGVTRSFGNFTRRAREGIERGTRRLSRTAASARSRAAAAAETARSHAAAAVETARSHASTLSNRVHSSAVTAKNRVLQSIHGMSESVQSKLHDLQHSLGNINLTVFGEYLTVNVIGEENMVAFKEKVKRLRLVRDIVVAIKKKDFEGFLMKYNNSKGNHGTDMNWLMQNISTLIFPVYLFPKFLMTFVMHKIGSSMEYYGVLLLKATEIIPLFSDEETAKYHDVYMNMNPKETHDLQKLKSLFAVDPFDPDAKPNLWSLTNALNIVGQSIRGFFFGLNQNTTEVMEAELRAFNDDQLSEILELLVNCLQFYKDYKPSFPFVPDHCRMQGDLVTIKTQFNNVEQCLVDSKRENTDLFVSFLLELVKTMAVDMHEFPIYKSIIVFVMAVVHEIKMHLRKHRGHRSAVSENIWRAKENMIEFEQPAAPLPPDLLPSGPNLEPKKIPPPLPPRPVTSVPVSPPEIVAPVVPVPPRDSSDDFYDASDGASDGEEALEEYDDLGPVRAVPSGQVPNVLGSYQPGTGLLPTKGLTLKKGFPSLSALGGRRRRKTRKPRRRPKRKSAYRKRR